MKRFILGISIGAFSFLSCNLEQARGPNGIVYKSAREYNDYIVNHQKEIINQIRQLSKMVDSDLDSAQRIRDNAVNNIDVAISEVKGMPAYKGDTTLRNAAINSFSFYKKIFSNEYQQIILVFKKGLPASSEDAALIKNINYEISIEEEKFDKSLHNAQKEFARQNHMQLVLK